MSHSPRDFLPRPSRVLAGGCFCGAIRYEAASIPFHETSCHCSICRRTTGAPFVAWFSVARAQFKLVRGEPRRLQSTAKGVRSFCPDCGTQLTFQHQDFQDEIDVTTCSLDQPNAAPPKDHTRVNDRLPWIRLADGLPEYGEGRQDG